MKTVVLSGDLSNASPEIRENSISQIGTQRAMSRTVVSEQANTNTVAPFRPRSGVDASVAPLAEDPTLEFAAEESTERKATRLPRWAMPALASGVGIAIVAGATWVGFGQTALTSGSLRVESDPPGAEVRIDGNVRGTTPVALTLPVGDYTLTVAQGSSVKMLPVKVSSGVGEAYHITWEPSSAVASSHNGSLYVTSDALGSIVIVDGSEKGQAPLTVRDLAPGSHEVVIRTANTTYRRSVQVEPGSTASLVVSGASAPAAWGWISLGSPISMQVLEGGRVVGTSEVDRIMLPPGDHELEFVSEPFGFRDSRRVKVAAGRAAAVSIAIPQASMNINALPWAEVLIDGVSVGDTPLANVQQPIGDHEIVFRHPQLGERRQVVRVTLRDAPRVSVDMRAR